jgi:hypothetical protein
MIAKCHTFTCAFFEILFTLWGDEKAGYVMPIPVYDSGGCLNDLSGIVCKPLM